MGQDPGPVLARERSDGQCGQIVVSCFTLCVPNGSIYPSSPSRIPRSRDSPSRTGLGRSHRDVLHLGDLGGTLAVERRSHEGPTLFGRNVL